MRQTPPKSTSLRLSSRSSSRLHDSSYVPPQRDCFGCFRLPPIAFLCNLKYLPVRVISSMVYHRNRVGVAVTTSHRSVSARAVACAAVVPSATDPSATDLSAVDPLDCSEAAFAVDPAADSVVEPAAGPADRSAVDPADRSEAGCGLAYARTLSTL